MDPSQLPPPTIQAFLALIICWSFSKVLSHLLVKRDIDNIPGPRSNSFLKGNSGQLFGDKNAWKFHESIAKQFGRVVGIHGPFGTKQLYVFDSKAAYHITCKDHLIFEETVGFIETNRIIFGEGLLASIGDVHRKQRKVLSPVFSVSHIRHMVPILYEVANKLRDGISGSLKNGLPEVDILRWTTRTALEMIGQSGLGHSFDSLVEGGRVHPYSTAAKDLAPTLFHFAFHRTYLLPTLVKLGSPRFRRFLVDLMPWENVRRLRDIIDTFHQTSMEVFENKKRALEAGDEETLDQVGRGKDIMSILMRANMQASGDEKLTDEEVLGQITAFVFGATDTTANALSRTFHLLAEHPQVQDKLRQEVMEAQKLHGSLDYDELSSLPLLDAVLRETLRLYPPVAVVSRAAREDIMLPLSAPIIGVDGREMDSIAVPKNTKVLISVLMANRDPMLWGRDVLEWKPERWLSPLPRQLVDANVPGVYSYTMTFLGGARACIGFKFSQVEMKIIIAVLLSAFRLSPAKEEIFWEMGPLITPTVKDQPGKPQLPMRFQPL